MLSDVEQVVTMMTQLTQRLERFTRRLEQAAADQCELHEVEREIFQETQAIGRELLGHFLENCGTGYQADQPPKAAAGVPLIYKGTSNRSYFSVFGEIAITRAAYAGTEGGYVYPLDARLNLPIGSKYSYLLQDWIGVGAVETDFRDAVNRLNRIFQFELTAHVPARLIEPAAAVVEAFYDAQPAPAAESEGSHLAFSADGKGVRLKKAEREREEKPSPPKPRLGRGEKNGVKKQAVVTAEFSFNPTPRTADEIIAALLNRKPADDEKPVEHPRQARNTHLQATLAGKEVAFETAMTRLRQRDPTGQKRIIALIDGDPALESGIIRAAQKAGLSDRFDAHILDIVHVSEYVWAAGTALHGEKGNARLIWVEDKLRALLNGKVGRVIGGLKQILTKNKLRPAARKTVQKTITYFTNHRHMMAYDQYLAKGYPIATGLVEGACGSFVKDRMEQSGMHWTIKGAQDVLDLRAVAKNQNWDSFWKFYTKNQKKQYAV